MTGIKYKPPVGICCPYFRSGQVLPSVRAATDVDDQDMVSGLSRHLLGDWGYITKEIWISNMAAISARGVVASVHRGHNGIIFDIITDLRRSQTLILLDSEY